MDDKVCRRCGRELTQEQRWRHCKYCSRTCYQESRFREVEWNGVKIRPGQVHEILKLCSKGMTLKEARQTVGANHKAAIKVRYTPEFSAFLPERICAVCGEAFPWDTPRSKYCSPKCSDKAAYARQRIARGWKERQIDHEGRNRAIDLYSRGLDYGSIARHLDIQVEKIYGWIHKSGVTKPTIICPGVAKLRPLKCRLEDARSSDEWASILHEAADESDFSGGVVLVCGTIHGGGAVERYAGIVLEKLRQPLLDGTCFAFCNVLCNAITTIEWRDCNFYLTRSLKTSGKFSWPSQSLGDFIVVSNSAFFHLIEYQKNGSKPLEIT